MKIAGTYSNIEYLLLYHASKYNYILYIYTYTHTIFTQPTYKKSNRKSKPHDITRGKVQDVPEHKF